MSEPLTPEELEAFKETTEAFRDDPYIVFEPELCWKLLAHIDALTKERDALLAAQPYFKDDRVAVMNVGRTVIERDNLRHQLDLAEAVCRARQKLDAIYGQSISALAYLQIETEYNEAFDAWKAAQPEPRT